MCYHVINIISSVSEPLPGYCSVNLTDTTKCHWLEASADVTYSATWDWHSHLALKVLFAISSITNCLNKSKTHAKLVVIIREATCTCRSSLDLPVAKSVVVKTSFFAKLCRQNIHYSSSMEFLLSSDQSKFCCQWYMYTFTAKKFDGGHQTHSRRCGRVTRLAHLLFKFHVLKCSQSVLLYYRSFFKLSSQCLSGTLLSISPLLNQLMSNSVMSVFSPWVWFCLGYLYHLYILMVILWDSN